MPARLRFIVFLIINLGVFSLHAASPKFYSINSIFGISVRNANSVCEDDNGFIWASCRTGILRLTDDDYRIYKLPYDPVDIITIKLIYKNSMLFAYTNDGQIFSYNPVFDRFDRLINLSKTINDHSLSISDLLIDDSGAFWIASSNGLYKYLSGEVSLLDTIITFGFPLAWFDDQQLIIGKSNGIWLFNIQSLQSKCIYENKDIFSFFVSCLYFDKTQDKLWIGTIMSGLFCFDFISGTFTGISRPSFPRQPILAIEENTDSTLLVGVDGQGIWVLNKESRQIIDVYKESDDDPSSLRGNGVYDIYRDNNKRVWVCTISGGVSFFGQASPLINHVVHHINDPNSLVNNDVNCIIEDREGKLWFATNNGISCWDDSSNIWKNYYHNKLEQAQVFLSLCEDDKGNIWAGSYSSGVYLLDGKTGRELAHYSCNIKGSPLGSYFVFSILKDSQGDIWIGGNSKLVCYFSKENIFRSYSKSTYWTSSLAELAPGQILLGSGAGLSLLNKDTGDSKNILPDIWVNDILVIDGKIWVCICGDGLIRFDYKNNNIERFTITSGLPSNFLNSIVYAEGYLWLGTEKGLCRFNPENCNVLNFSSGSPLWGIPYNSSSPFLTNNGQLAWGTNNGAVFFEPGSIKDTPLKGRIFFQDILISGRSVREIPTFRLHTPVDSIQSLKLKYSHNNLSMELLPMGSPPDSKFSWKMEGFDHDWTPPTDNRILTYTNIPSGKFTLKIRLYDSSLSQVIAERSVSMKLIPPFWRTAWFFIIIFMVSWGLIFLYFLYYINRLKQIHTEEKVRFFTNTAHDIRTALTLIKAPVEELDREKNLSLPGRNYLRLAIEQIRQLSSVVTQLMDFQKADIGKEKLLLSKLNIAELVRSRIMMFESFAKSRNVEIIFKRETEEFPVTVDGSKIEKVVDNLISNAIKYSHPGSQVQILLNHSESRWELQVKDHGIGISQKAKRLLFKEFYRGDNAVNTKTVGSGIGLLLVKKYVALHRGSISYDSQENVGTTFRIVIPYKNGAFSTKGARSVSGSYPSLIQSAQNIPLMPSESEVYLYKEMKVLIVEDNDDLLNFMTETLSKNFNVITALDGEKAWKTILEIMPDLIISDVMMPGMDGFKLCQLIKSTYETSHIPVILLTALSEKMEQMQGLSLGADDYLTKPFDMNLLELRIKTIICNRKTVREKALNLINENQPEPLFENKLNDKFVKKLMEVAKSNISNAHFSKDEFASTMNVSPSLLYKKIKSLTGQSLTDFLKTIRFNYALKLLQTRKYSVTEVSELCGYTSVTYFSTAFKKFFGKSPMDVLK